LLQLEAVGRDIIVTVGSSREGYVPKINKQNMVKMNDN